MRGSSAPGNPEPPPIFVKYSRNGSPVHAEIVRRGVSWRQDAVGEQYCVAQAPNGLCAYGELKFGAAETPPSRYQKVVGLLFRENQQAGNEPRHLLADPGEPGPGPQAPEQPAMALWQHGECVSPQRWKIVPSQAIGTMRLDAEDGADHLQTWTEHGPSVISRCPRSADLYLAEAYGRSGKLTVPRFTGSAKPSAYWGFLRHGFVEAASELGQIIALEASDEEPEVIVSAHWAARFGRGKVVGVIAERLAQARRGDTDTLVMRWVLAFENGASTKPNERRSLLEEAVRAARKLPPLYTETLRLMIDALGASGGLPEPGSGSVDTEAVEWIRKLGACTYWNTETTTYRGLEPGWPDPDATGATVPAVAKKKSATA